MTTTPGGSALERLQAHIEAEVAAGLANLDRYRGNHLAAITPFEQEVFHIEMHDIPRLGAAYWAWEVACGIIHDKLAGDPDLANALAAELEIVRQGRALSAEDRSHTDFAEAWTAFAKLFGIPYRLAFAFFWKNYFMDVRLGHILHEGDYHGPDFMAVAHTEDEPPF